MPNAIINITEPDCNTCRALNDSLRIITLWMRYNVKLNQSSHGVLRLNAIENKLRG